MRSCAEDKRAKCDSLYKTEKSVSVSGPARSCISVDDDDDDKHTRWRKTFLNSFSLHVSYSPSLTGIFRKIGSLIHSFIGSFILSVVRSIALAHRRGEGGRGKSVETCRAESTWPQMGVQIQKGEVRQESRSKETKRASRKAQIRNLASDSGCLKRACARARLLVKVEHDTAGEVSRVHGVVDLGQVREAESLVLCLDLSAGGDIEGLDTVLSVSDVGSDDAERAEDGEEDVGLDGCVAWETDGDEGTAATEVVERLLVSCCARCGYDSGVRAETVGSGLYVGDEILGLLEVDERFSAELGGQCFFVGASVDSDDAVSGSSGVLDRQVTQSTTGTGDDDVLARSELGLLDGLVDGHTGAKDGCGILEGKTLGDGSEVTCERDGVLLEGTVDGESGALGLSAVGLKAATAEVTLEAGVGDPLDAHTVTDLDVLVGSLAQCDDDAGTLVTTDEGQLVVERPVTEHGVQVGVAYTGVKDLGKERRSKK